MISELNELHLILFFVVSAGWGAFSMYAYLTLRDRGDI